MLPVFDILIFYTNIWMQKLHLNFEPDTNVRISGLQMTFLINTFCTLKLVFKPYTEKIKPNAINTLTFLSNMSRKRLSSAHSDQTTSTEAAWSLSTLFVSLFFIFRHYSMVANFVLSVLWSKVDHKNITEPTDR